VVISAHVEIQLETQVNKRRCSKENETDAFASHRQHHAIEIGMRWHKLFQKFKWFKLFAAVGKEFKIKKARGGLE